VFGAATGASSHEFFVIAYCPDRDEIEIRQNPSHQHFTHILYFKDLNRSVVETLHERLEDLWRSPSGQVYGVGAPRGILEITPASCSEVSLPDIPGTFERVWGTGENHVFACGSFEPFLLYRRFGAWQSIPLPEGTENLRGMVGFSESDLYLVGDHGQILHFDGNRLTRLESPTTRHLVSAERLDETLLCIGGYTGVLLCGNKNGWRYVPSGTDEPILSLARLGARVCFGTPDGVWTFDGRSGPSALVDVPTRWINGLGDAVMLAGDTDTWLYDGQTLTKLDDML
jgi:hypothetical protein